MNSLQLTKTIKFDKSDRHDIDICVYIIFTGKHSLLYVGNDDNDEAE